MALRWNFKEKAGLVTQVQTGPDGEQHEFTLPFYVGNAMMIVTYEFTDDDGKDKYDLMWFFTGVDHAKNCLGLKKNLHGTQENMFGENGITRLVIYREWCRDWQKIVDLFTMAFPEIEIDIRAREPAQEGGVTRA